MRFILGKKLEMTQIWKDKKVAPVTLIEAGPCFVIQTKDEKTDGYEAVQIGFEKIEKKNKIKKTMKGKEFRYIREQRTENKEQELKVGDEINVSIFQEGDKVKISGISKGKGFQGGVKRWGFHGRNATHGTKHEQRTLGSVGCGYPQRVIKGKKNARQNGRGASNNKKFGNSKN